MEDAYILSLSRCVRWAARGGKSGSDFHKTLDDRLVLKQMSRFELQSFLDVAQDYFDYIIGAVENKVGVVAFVTDKITKLAWQNDEIDRIVFNVSVICKCYDCSMRSAVV